MLQFQMMAMTGPYWAPAEQAERERRAARAALATAATTRSETATPAPDEQPFRGGVSSWWHRRVQVEG